MGKVYAKWGSWGGVLAQVLGGGVCVVPPSHVSHLGTPPLDPLWTRSIPPLDPLPTPPGQGGMHGEGVCKMGVMGWSIG